MLQHIQTQPKLHHHSCHLGFLESFLIEVHMDWCMVAMGNWEFDLKKWGCCCCNCSSDWLNLSSIISHIYSFAPRLPSIITTYLPWVSTACFIQILIFFAINMWKDVRSKNIPVFCTNWKGKAFSFTQGILVNTVVRY